MVIQKKTMEVDLEDADEIKNDEDNEEEKGEI